MYVFVYGTLTRRETATAVLETFEYRGPAILEGLHRVDGTYPTLLPGGYVDGRLLETDALRALDQYEGVDRGLYARVEIPSDSDRPIETYVGDPTRLSVADKWPGGGSFPECVRTYVAENDVQLRTEIGETTS